MAREAPLSARQFAQVAIIGAGPAGAVAASLLQQQGVQVTVLEKSRFPRFSIGESLLPACMDIIARTGVLDSVNNACFQPKDGATFSRNGQQFSFDFHDKFSAGPATTFQVKRAPFDQLLADHASSLGATIRYQHEVEQVDVDPKRPVLSVLDESGQSYELETDFILDASGSGRVLPRLLGLLQPSQVPPRKSLFTHIDGVGPSEEFDRNKVLIAVHPESADTWYWLVPFSDGTCSFGVVAEPEWFEGYPDDPVDALRQFASEEPTLSTLLEGAQYPNRVGELVGFAASARPLYTDRFALLGDAGEFLDPVFSSGITIAMKSAELASDLLVRQFRGESVDWEQDFVDALRTGVETFRCYVEGWYSGELQDVIFHQDPEPTIKAMVCSILAGYAWDTNNPYVAQPRRRLSVLAEMCRLTAG
jgi:flavin-dependent dehydrogenase